uniref:Protease inhibitor-like protein-A n=1 Tax=Mytilus coruscus TaxID=42192 RepID=A0A0K0YB15_MYTCO|nr:protease inhibitor-like protein-A [Mytilus coruscus]
MKTPIVTLFGLLLINFISEAYGCECPNPELSKWEHFCDAEFVLRGTVKSKKDCGDPEVVYKVEVKENFLKYHKMDKIIKIRSPVNSCDPRLEIGSEYIITGDVRGEFYYTDRCRWNQEWQTISKTDRTEIESGSLC